MMSIIDSCTNIYVKNEITKPVAKFKYAIMRPSLDYARTCIYVVAKYDKSDCDIFRKYFDKYKLLKAELALDQEPESDTNEEPEEEAEEEPEPESESEEELEPELEEDESEPEQEPELEEEKENVKGVIGILQDMIDDEKQKREHMEMQYKIAIAELKMKLLEEEHKVLIEQKKLLKLKYNTLKNKTK